MAPHTRGADAPLYTDETGKVPQPEVPQLVARVPTPRLGRRQLGDHSRSHYAAATASGTIVSHP